MALLEKLKEVRIVKQNYFVLQHRFYGELSKKFPYIMKHDIAKLANKLESELHTLLCASLKYKSVKIRLTAISRWENSVKTYVNVQRTEPGFYYPQSQRGHSDAYYMDLNQFITDKDDMYERGISEGRNDSKKDHLFIALSELKKAGHQIIPEKLDVYFKFLREIMAYRPKFLCYTEGINKECNVRRIFTVKGLKFDLQSKSMDITFKKLRHEESNGQYRYGNSRGHFRYEQNSHDILHMLDYSELNSSNDFDKNIHDRLKIFINNYKEIRTKFEYEEKKKEKVYKICLDFLKQIRVHTLPFKVLNEITKQ